jgi:hypothetical protein
MSTTTENAVNTTETTNFDETDSVTLVADVSAKVTKAGGSAVTKKKARSYNRRLTSERVEVLQDIVNTLGKTVITRKELKTFVDPDNGRPWNSFAFIYNATECFVTGDENATGQKRGVYNLERIAKTPFKRKG